MKVQILYMMLFGLFFSGLQAQQSTYFIEDKLGEMVIQDSTIYVLGSQGIWSFNKGDAQGQLIYKSQGEQFIKVRFASRTQELWITDSQGNLYAFDLKSQRLDRISDNLGQVTAMFYDKESAKLYVGSFQGELKTWDVQSKKQLQSFNVSRTAITDIVHSNGQIHLSNLRGKIFTLNEGELRLTTATAYQIRALCDVPFWDLLLMSTRSQGVFLNYYKQKPDELVFVDISLSEIKDFSVNDRQAIVSILDEDDKLVIMGKSHFYTYEFSDETIQDVLLNDSVKLSFYLATNKGLKLMGVEDFELYDSYY